MREVWGKSWLKNCDPLSAIMFNFQLENEIRDANVNVMGLIYHKKHKEAAKYNYKNEEGST